MKKLSKYLLAVLATVSIGIAGVSVASNHSEVQADTTTREQGVDISGDYQGQTAVFGQASDKFAVIQIGGYYNGSFHPQQYYGSQVSSTIAQGKRAQTYIYSEFNSRAQADQMLDYYLPKVQTPKNSIVALDVESGTPNTDAVLYALNRVKQAGYTAVLYGYKGFLTAHLDLSTIASQYPLWLAEYPDYQVRTTPDYNFFPSYNNIHMFQFTSMYKAGGLDGDVDLLGITKNGYGANGKSDQGGGAVTPDSNTPATDNGQNANNTPKSDISVGYTVKVNFSASKWANGTSIPSWVKGKSYKVQQVNKTNKTVLLSGILSWINRSDVEILQTNTPVAPNNTVNTYYTVASGDSWWSIAKKFGLNMYTLASNNGKTINSTIFPGQRLIVGKTTVNNSSSLPTGVHAQTGVFTPNQKLMVWNGAGTGATGVYYYAGEPIYYQGYIDNYTAGYRYVVYKSNNGQWHYVADRHLNPSYYLGSIR